MLHITGDIFIVISVIVIWHFGNVKSNICFTPLASFGGRTPKQFNTFEHKHKGNQREEVTSIDQRKRELRPTFYIKEII